MNNEIRPNEEEIMFLDLSYNKFYDLFDEVMAEDFWNKPPFIDSPRLKMPLLFTQSYLTTNQLNI